MWSECSTHCTDYSGSRNFFSKISIQYVVMEHWGWHNHFLYLWKLLLWADPDPVCNSSSAEKKKKHQLPAHFQITKYYLLLSLNHSSLSIVLDCLVASKQVKDATILNLCRQSCFWLSSHSNEIQTSKFI